MNLKNETNLNMKDAKMTTPHVQHNSGNNEWYTPVHLIEAARSTMGSIDTDPASCFVAQLNVTAKVFYTEETNGLDKSWFGNVWMNPPYSGKLVKQFIEKLKYELSVGNTQQSVVLVNNTTETQAGQSLLGMCSAVCFLKGRVKFLDETGVPKKTPLQGQMVLYFGNMQDNFMLQFKDLGNVFIK